MLEKKNIRKNKLETHTSIMVSPLG